MQLQATSFSIQAAQAQIAPARADIKFSARREATEPEFRRMQGLAGVNGIDPDKIDPNLAIVDDHPRFAWSNIPPFSWLAGLGKAFSDFGFLTSIEKKTADDPQPYGACLDTFRSKARADAEYQQLDWDYEKMNQRAGQSLQYQVFHTTGSKEVLSLVHRVKFDEATPPASALAENTLPESKALPELPPGLANDSQDG
ncbi:MAG: hypothetical protein SFZ03_05110 [Candidatus Melainabacteria bacterium]|nr:hypothetical protein [Candidatus Melainabacteria bacterium]